MTRAELSRAAKSVSGSRVRPVKYFLEKENADKYTDENLVREVKNITDGIFTDLDPENVGRPLLVVLIGDEGHYYRKSPGFDGDYDSLITSLGYVIDDLKERSPGQDIA